MPQSEGIHGCLGRFLDVYWVLTGFGMVLIHIMYDASVC